MPLYAFLNELRLPEGKVCASDLENDSEQWKKDRNYFCPSPKCTAQMRFRKSSALHCAHFYAKAPEGKHSELCSYAKLDAYNPDNFNEEGFNICGLLLLIVAFYIPQKFPEQWKASFLHMPNTVYYSLLVLSGLTEVATLAASVIATSAPVFIGNLVLVGVLAAYACFRYKSGKTHINILVDSEDMETLTN